MVGRELLTICPFREDHQGHDRGGSPTKVGASGDGKRRGELKSFPKAMTTMSKALRSVLHHMVSLAMSFISQALIWDQAFGEGEQNTNSTTNPTIRRKKVLRPNLLLLRRVCS